MARLEKGRKKTGGRKAGVHNKTTQRRIDAAERAIVLAKAGGKRLAREVLEDFVELFSAIALTHQPALPGAEPNPSYDEKKFEKFARLAVDTATALASYQTPKLKAVLVGPELCQPQSNGAERLSGEELTRRLEERGLPPFVFGYDKPTLLPIEHPPGANGHANGSGDGDDL
jgi:hypothetical protein